MVSDQVLGSRNWVLLYRKPVKLGEITTGRVVKGKIHLDIYINPRHRLIYIGPVRVGTTILQLSVCTFDQVASQAVSSP